MRVRKRVRGGGGPPRRRGFDDHDGVAPRRLELQGIYGRSVRRVGVEVPVLSRQEIVQVTAHPGVIGFPLRRLKLRYRDRGQNADDHDNYEKLDERKTAS